MSNQKLNIHPKQKFNRLTTVKEMGRNKYGAVLWECACDCGNKTITTSSSLNQGNTKSCGCLQREFQQTSKTTHGLRKHRLYTTWLNMKKRCLNLNATFYKNYGGRGIKVCDEWVYNFQNFFDWSIKNGYEDNLTIERINIDEDYKPSNCKFITKSEQPRNQTRNIKYKGELAIDASKRLGGGSHLVRDRIALGWSLQDAFSIKGNKETYGKRTRISN